MAEGTAPRLNSCRFAPAIETRKERGIDITADRLFTIGADVKKFIANARALSAR